MRAGWLLLSMLVMAGLTACQQESTLVTTVIEPEATTPSQQAAQSEAAKVIAPIAESIPEAAEENVEEATKEVAATEKVDTNKAADEVRTRLS